MRWLHGFLDDFYQLLPKRYQVHFITQGGAESFYDFGCVVFATIEAAVDDALDATTQWPEEGVNQ